MKRTLMAMLVTLGLLMSIIPHAHAADGFADNSFKAVWDRTDAAVASGKSSNSWLWGPQPNSAGLVEGYAQSPNGRRLVQYWDKARMEINNPNANRGELWYVTNGLLPIELITGQMQIGDAQFEKRTPANIPAVGDPDNTFPTYADLGNVFTRLGAGDRVGNPVTGFFTPDGKISGYDTYRNDPATLVAAVENNHGIPAGFLAYMNAQSGSLGRLFVFGAPVSGAYWVTAKVGGVERPVIVQVFERRVLTYTPSNDPAFRVESGNVGQHYFRWRYGR
jgi:hypothetical protein